MSLLGGGSRYVPITVYPQELVTDIDGNPRTRPSVTGIATTARFQPLSQSGTSARISEQDVEGFESEEGYTMRFPSSFTTALGPQSEIEWNGKRWAIFGFPEEYNSSRRTAHQIFQVKRK